VKLEMVAIFLHPVVRPFISTDRELFQFIETRETEFEWYIFSRGIDNLICLCPRKYKYHFKERFHKAILGIIIQLLLKSVLV